MTVLGIQNGSLTCPAIAACCHQEAWWGTQVELSTRVLTHGFPCGIGLLAWWLDSENISRDLEGTCKAFFFYGLASYVPEYYFCHTLSVKQVTKLSPDSWGEWVRFHLLWDSDKATLQNNAQYGRYCCTILKNGICYAEFCYIYTPMLPPI